MQTWEGLVGVVYKILRAKGRSNSQQTVLGVVASVLIVVCKWMKQLSTNNVGSCCVLVDSGVQTDATTPNNVGPSTGVGPSREVIALLSPRRPCVMRVLGGPNNVGRAVQHYSATVWRSRN